MASARDLDKNRGECELRLTLGLGKLTKACGVDAPNLRTVGNLLNAVNTGYDALMEAHVVLVMKQNGDLGEPRNIQYMEKHLDAVDNVKEMAEVIVGVREGTAEEPGAAKAPEVNIGNLKDDVNVMNLRMNALIA